MKIIKERTHELVHDYQLTFSTTDENGRGHGGASFECDEHGNINEEELKKRPVAYNNYLEHLKAFNSESSSIARLVDVHYFPVSENGETVYKPIYCTGHWKNLKLTCEVKDYEKWIHEPAVGLCNRCNEEVILDGFTNTCECGADYNMSGQELADRSQWGCETGESLSDILRIK